MARWAGIRRRCSNLTRTIDKQFGIAAYEAAKLNEMAKERVLAGFQLGFHAIGDKGIQMALDAFAESEKAAKRRQGESGERRRRFPPAD